MLERTNEWSPNAADPTPAGNETLRGGADGARDRDRAREDPRPAGPVHAAAQHVRPRDRLGARVLPLQQPGPDPRAARLPARRRADPVHLQLVLHRLRAHRVPERRRQPDPRPAGGRQPARARAVRVARVGAGNRPHPPVARRELDARAEAPARGRPALHRRLERQAGARLRRGGRQLGLRPRLSVEAARRPGPPARRGQPQGDPPGPDRGDGRRRDGGPPGRRRAAVGAARAARRPRARRSASCAPGCATALTGSTRTATVPTSTPRRSRSWTRGGRAWCARSSSPCSASGCSTR